MRQILYHRSEKNRTPTEVSNKDSNCVCGEESLARKLDVTMSASAYFYCLNSADWKYLHVFIMVLI